jgi:eukaryotic-like serine/threonine-protein kinase
MSTEVPFEPGNKIGSYEIMRELGRGGMGCVFLARDAAVGGRLVAIKIILATARDEAAEAHARFLHEIRNLARLRHPNIVTIFTAGTHEGHPYFVMDYVAGRDLARFVDECATLGERERIVKITHVMAQVARAVHHAHTKKIVHRDLKPTNILLTHEADEPMILDFGVAKDLADTSLTQGSQSPGTPAYRAPEQIDVARKLRDELIDVWALGVILYRTLTGTHPFKGNDALSLSMQVVSAAPQPMRELQAQIPPLVEDVVLACLEKDPHRRPESALAVAELLERVLHADGAPAAFSGGEPPADRVSTAAETLPSVSTEGLLERVLRSPKATWLVASILLALLGVAGWAVSLILSN